MVGHFRLSMLRLHCAVCFNAAAGEWSHAHLASRLKSREPTLPVLKVVGSPQWRGFIRVPQLLFGRVPALLPYLGAYQPAPKVDGRGFGFPRLLGPSLPRSIGKHGRALCQGIREERTRAGQP
jgi:hypothetical protein